MSYTVVYYTNSDNFGGAEQVLLTVLSKLDRNSWRPILAYHRGQGISSFIAAVESLDVDTISMPEIQGFTDIKNILKFAKQLRTIRPTIFHANLNWPLSCTYGIIAAYLAGVKTIIATQHLYSYMNSQRIQLEQKIISYFVDNFIAVSIDVARRLRDVINTPDKIQVVHNGIILENYSSIRDNIHANDIYGPLKENRREFPIVLTIARLDKQKGHKFLLKAARDVPSTLFVFVGDGPERENLENEALELGLNDRVIFLGRRNDISALLDGCDLFVLPSLFEGLPLSIMEAMAAGKPVIASDIGGIDELIINGNTGYLTPPGDPQALATAINMLLSTPRLSQKIAAAGQALVFKEFSADQMLKGITDIYNDNLYRRGCIN
ncbi:MAG: glycosyltransferase [Thermodesulfobacteriota bacterium]